MFLVHIIKIIYIFNMNEGRKNHFSSIFMYTVHLLHFLVLVCKCLYVNSCLPFEGSMSLRGFNCFHDSNGIVTNLLIISTLWAIYLFLMNWLLSLEQFRGEKKENLAYFGNWYAISLNGTQFCSVPIWLQSNWGWNKDYKVKLGSKDRITLRIYSSLISSDNLDSLSQSSVLREKKRSSREEESEPNNWRKMCPLLPRPKWFQSLLMERIIPTTA
jgi:hypothetical protein